MCLVVLPGYGSAVHRGVVISHASGAATPVKGEQMHALAASAFVSGESGGGDIVARAVNIVVRDGDQCLLRLCIALKMPVSAREDGGGDAAGGLVCDIIPSGDGEALGGRALGYKDSDNRRGRVVEKVALIAQLHWHQQLPGGWAAQRQLKTGLLAFGVALLRPAEGQCRQVIVTDVEGGGAGHITDNKIAHLL